MSCLSPPTCEHVDVLPDALDLRAVVEVRRADGLTDRVPVSLTARLVRDALLSHDVQQLPKNKNKKGRNCELNDTRAIDSTGQLGKREGGGGGCNIINACQSYWRQRPLTWHRCNAATERYVAFCCAVQGTFCSDGGWTPAAAASTVRVVVTMPPLVALLRHNKTDLR